MDYKDSRKLTTVCFPYWTSSLAPSLLHHLSLPTGEAHGVCLKRTCSPRVPCSVPSHLLLSGSEFFSSSICFKRKSKRPSTLTYIGSSTTFCLDSIPSCFQ
uniref:Uncharacterized protein n=1 Tax=Cacopsylla melanoneura TaxID=428564 RepID=A0A8D8TNG8_9HEMI